MRGTEKVNHLEDHINSLSGVSSTERKGLLDNSGIQASQSPMDLKYTADVDFQQALELDMVEFLKLDQKIKEAEATEDEEEKH